MTEHPILFSGPMVRAILDGHKIQTRRAMRPQIDLSQWPLKPGALEKEKEWRYMPRVADWHHIEENMWGLFNKEDKPSDVPYTGIKCPFGKPGDRLWVRETHGIIQPTHATPGGKPYDQGPVYRADGDEAPTWDEGPFEFSGWRSSIHMPRWASRLTLEVTDVYVKQLQNMGKYDAQAEGFWPNGHVQDTDGCDVWCPKASAEEAKSQFIDYWDSRYDKQGFGWNANPWVFVVNFKDITKEK